jgi:hypothetical protein
VSGSGPGGRWFKSNRPDHLLKMEHQIIDKYMDAVDPSRHFLLGTCLRDARICVIKSPCERLDVNQKVGLPLRAVDEQAQADAVLDGECVHQVLESGCGIRPIQPKRGRISPRKPRNLSTSLRAASHPNANAIGVSPGNTDGELFPAGS